jgi:hypothetical protein
MYVFLTENMVGHDFATIRRCYDLKGSSYGRFVEVNDIQAQITGETGLKVLKCQNFVNDNAVE